MLGPVGKGWSPEATPTSPVERNQPNRQRSVTETPNLSLQSRVSPRNGRQHRDAALLVESPLPERGRQQEAGHWRVQLRHDVVVERHADRDVTLSLADE
jgi:hypothetical protein